MSIATGREPDAKKLIAGSRGRTILVMPQVCIMEAYSALDGLRAARTSFEQTLDHQLSQLKRDVTSQNAKELAKRLVQARIANRKLIEHTDLRLKQVIAAFASKARLLPLSTSVIDFIYKHPIIARTRDNLILHCILEDARSQGDLPKALLTGNTRDFKSPDVQAELTRAGITKNFPDAKNALGWIASLPKP